MPIDVHFDYTVVAAGAAATVAVDALFTRIRIRIRHAKQKLFKGKADNVIETRTTPYSNDDDDGDDDYDERSEKRRTSFH